MKVYLLVLIGTSLKILKAFDRKDKADTYLRNYDYTSLDEDCAIFIKEMDVE